MLFQLTLAACLMLSMMVWIRDRDLTYLYKIAYEGMILEHFFFKTTYSNE